MDVRSELNESRHLEFCELSEPEVHMLRLVIEEARPGPIPEELEGKVLGQRILATDETSRVFEIVWPSCLTYSVVDEMYTDWDDTQVWEGSFFREYSKSHFLDYAFKATFFSALCEDKPRHWSLLCLNHTVHVIGVKEPQMRYLGTRGETL